MNATTARSRRPAAASSPAWCDRCGAFCDSLVCAAVHCLVDPSSWCLWCGSDLHGKGRAFCDPDCAHDHREDLQLARSAS